MDGHLDETVHVICLKKFENNRRYKEQALQEIIAAVCAMLNSSGGKVLIHIDTDSKEITVEGSTFSHMSLVIRILEQSMISIIGTRQAISNMNFKTDQESIVVSVKKADFLITTNYNLYLPSETQVVLLSTVESPEHVKDDIMNRKFVLEPVQLGSHYKTFLKDKNCGFHESKNCQLKNLKADSSKRTTLADRMTGKGNKFSCYVSAFANHSGGHIYYGIRHDKVVEGELIRNEDDKSEITKKVEKAIKKMIWPQHIGQPKRGEHWEIFFELVIDENSNHIPSTFVVVIYIAPCLGGVFTEEPECYEMVDGKVQKMSVITWMKRISEPVELSEVDNFSSKIKRITWSSTKIRNICTLADQLLTQSVNNGKSIQTISVNLENSFPALIEVQLVVLSKKVMVGYRSGCFKMAEKLLREYTDLQTKTTEIGVFEAIRIYLQTAFYRATGVKGDSKALNTILPEALNQAERIAPGLVSAALHLLAATVISPLESKNDEVGHSVRALEHLQHVQDSPIVRADMEQRAHIILALLHLGCNISGELTKKDVDSESLEKAKSSVMAVRISIDEGNLMNIYREIQFNLVQSVLSYRCSQVQPDRKVSFLKQAFNFSKRAEYRAGKHGFSEMLNWARVCMALYTEDLVRIHFTFRSGTHSESKTHPKSGIHSESKTHPKSGIHSESKTHRKSGFYFESKTHRKSGIHSESKTRPKPEAYFESNTNPPQNFVIEINEEAETSACRKFASK